MAVPVAKFSADAGAQIGQAGYELRGRLATPFTPRELIGKTAGKIMPDIATAAQPIVAKATATLAGVAQQGVDLAQDTVNAGKLRLGLSSPASAEAMR